MATTRVMIEDGVLIESVALVLADIIPKIDIILTCSDYLDYDIMRIEDIIKQFQKDVETTIKLVKKELDKDAAT